jgi:hypothetical protein
MIAQSRGSRDHEAKNGPGILLRGVTYLLNRIHDTSAPEIRSGQYWEMKSIDDTPVGFEMTILAVSEQWAL